MSDGTAADDMLDGTCCQVCGEFFDDVIDGEEPPGFPRTCRACQPRSRRPNRQPPAPGSSPDASKEARP